MSVTHTNGTSNSIYRQILCSGEKSELRVFRREEAAQILHKTCRFCTTYEWKTNTYMFEVDASYTPVGSVHQNFPVMLLFIEQVKSTPVKNSSG